MANHKETPANTTELVRTSILVKAETDQALRELADRGKRPLSWEIRTALEEYVERAKQQVPA